MSNSKNFDETMERHIGDYGGTEAVHEVVHEEPTLTKLQYMEDKKADEGVDAFNALTDKIRKVDFTDDNTIGGGWIPIDRYEMGVRSQFYPSDWEFRVKPANVLAIRNWASIDEENLSAVNNVMNEIIKTCVSIHSDYGKVSWEKINSWDRFWFIMKVHQYTFKQGENKIEFDDECPECGESITYTLRPDTLYYEFPDDSVIDNCWNYEKMVWTIDPKAYGVEGRVQTLYTPTLGKDNALIQWLYQQNQSGKKIDETFIKFLPYMLDKAPKDINLLDKQIKDLKRTFDSWDTDMFLFMDEVVRNITINPSEKLRQKCESCGGEVCSNVRFPNGIKRLFVVQGKHSKFGSR